MKGHQAVKLVAIVCSIFVAGAGCSSDDHNPDRAKKDISGSEDVSVVTDADGDTTDSGADAKIDLDIRVPDEPSIGVDAANKLPPSHKRADGQWMFFNETFGTELFADWPPPEFMLQLMEKQPETFGDQYEEFGFIKDPEGEFPVGFKRGTQDSDQMRQTCALCHVGRLPDGRLWIGAPNTELNFARFKLEVNDAWTAAGNKPFLTDIQQKKLERIGPGRIGAESSTYPQAVPADFPVYFNLGERTHLNYMGTGQTARSEI
jgi:hypothetical protein